MNAANDDGGEIPHEQMAWVLDVMIAELYMGFERRHVRGEKRGEYTGFQWRLRPASIPDDVRLPDHLQRLRKWQPGVPPLVSDKAGFSELFTLMNTTADRSGWAWQMVRTPRVPLNDTLAETDQHYVVMLGQVLSGPGVAGFRPLVSAEAHHVQIAMAVALVLAKQESWQAWHRKLYPGAYLKLAQG